MRAARSVFVLAFGPIVVTCGGSVEDPAPSITIVRASVRNEGYRMVAVIDARLVGGSIPSALDLWAGAAWDRSGKSSGDRGDCGPYAGWLLDIDEASRRHVLGAREERFVTLRATSFTAPACDPDAVVAVCCEPITVVLGSAQVVGDAYPTALSCIVPRNGS